MKTWFKYISISLVTVVVVTVVGMAIFLLTFDPNAYKYKLEEIVQQRYHRSLSIDGKIELSLFPRIGLSVSEVSLSEPQSKEVFASMASLRVGVAVWPLLSNSLVVDHVTISGLKARLVRDKGGALNVRNLIESTVAPQASSSDGTKAETDSSLSAMAPGRPWLSPLSSQEMQIDIGGLELKNSQVQLIDQASSMAIVVSDINANTGRITFNQAFDMRLTAKVEGGEPRVDANVTTQAMLTFNPSQQRFSVQKLDMRIGGKVLQSQLKALTVHGNLVLDSLGSTLDLSEVEVAAQGDVLTPTATISNIEASLSVPKLGFDWKTPLFQLEKLAVRVKGRLPDGPLEFALDAPKLQRSASTAAGESITGRMRKPGLDTSFSLTGVRAQAGDLTFDQVKVNGTATRDARTFKLDISSPITLAMTQGRAQASSLRGEMNISAADLPKEGLKIPFEGNFLVDWLKNSANSKLDAVLDGHKLALNTDISGLNEAPSVKFTMVLDALNLDKLIPADTAVVQPVKAGDAVANASPASPERKLDVSALLKPNLNGTIKIGQLVTHGLTSNEVALAVTSSKGQLHATLNAALYGGKLSGDIKADLTRQNLLGAKMALTGVAMESLFTDVLSQSRVSGTGNLSLEIKTSGMTVDALKSGLNGTGQLRIRQGALHGVSVPQVLQALRQFGLKHGYSHAMALDADKKTPFADLESNFSFAQGVVEVKKLNFVSPLLQVTQGQPASIDLQRRELNLVANIRVLKTGTDSESRLLRALKGVLLPVHITGPFDKPSYTVLWKATALGKALERLSH